MTQSRESSFSRIVGGAAWVPRVTPAGWFALQVDLPQQLSGLDELFSLQLLVKRAISVLENSPGSKHLVIDKNQLRIRFAPCCLSAWVVLGERYEINHNAPKLELAVNCLLDLEPGAIERLRRKPPGDEEKEKPWLLRGTLVSGSIKMKNPTDALIHAARFVARLWPRKGDVLEGIYLAGSQFQIQVSPADKETNLERKGGCRRLQFVGASRDSDGEVVGAIWKQVTVRDGSVDNPADTLYKHKDKIMSLIDGNPDGFPNISVERNDVEAAILAQVGPDPDRSEGAWSVREFVRPGMTFLFTTTLKDGAVVESHSTRWTPGTLLINTESDEQDPSGTPKTVYQLIDHDEVESFLATGKRSVLPDSEQQGKAHAHIIWSDQGPRLESLGITSLVGARAGHVDIASPERINLWQLCQTEPLQPDDAWDDQPPGWLRYRVDPPTGVPRSTEALPTRISSLTQPLVMPIAINNERDWRLEIDLDQAAVQQVPLASPVRLSCEIRPADNILSLEFFAADLEVATPRMKFYQADLPDPLSVPNERELDTGGDGWADYQLVFRADPTSEAGSVRATWVQDLGVFDITGTGDAITAFLPSTRALIDPVSPTRGNLIAQQVIRLPVWKTADKVYAMIDEDGVKPEGNKKDGFKTQLKLILPRPLPNTSVFAGLYSSWRLIESDGDPAIIRVAEHGTRSIKLSGQHTIFKDGQEYALSIGPSRLAVPRDPNHGLIPVQFGKLKIVVQNDKPLPTIRFDVRNLRGTESSSVLALFPWGEWGPLPPKWLLTGRVRLHHRNLVQEHAEFESSFEDRFPPQGPPVDPNSGQPQSPLLPFDDFVRAVRDRYTEASGNLEVENAQIVDKTLRQLVEQEAKRLRNWLTGTDLSAAGVNSPITSQLEFKESRDSVFPQVSLSWKDSKGKDVSGPVPGKQSLQVRKPGDRNDGNWLEFDAATESLQLKHRPEIQIREATETARPETRRLVNSSAPLLFDRHDITTIGMLHVSPKGHLVLLGRPKDKAVLWRSTPPESLPSIPGSTSPATAGALCRAGGRVVGVVGREDATVTVFEVDGAMKVKELEIPDTPDPGDLVAVVDVAIAEHGAQPVLAVAFQTENNTRLFVFRHDGTRWQRDELPLPNDRAKVSAVAIESSESSTEDSVRRIDVASGFASGQIARWQKKGADAWPDAKILIAPKDLSSVPIEDLAIDVADVEGNRRVRIVAADGTRAVKLWTDAEKQTTHASVEHPASVFSVCMTHAVNVDDRTDRKDAAAESFIVTGSDDGRVRLWRLSDQLSLVRTASTGAAVRHVAAERLPFEQRGLTDENNPFTLAAATGDGRIWLWEGRSMTELSAPPALRAACVLDNLGVLRALPSRDRSQNEPDREEGTWTIESLQVPVPGKPGNRAPDPELWQSVTVHGAEIAKKLPANGGEITGLTDIRFSCESLKVRPNEGGSLPEYRFYEAPCNLGQCGFYSDIFAAPDSGLKLLDRWPRLLGMPIYVTRLRSLKMGDDGPEDMLFESVLVNPDELAAGVEYESERFDVAGLVRRAISRDSLLVVSVDFNQPASAAKRVKIEKSSRVDWLFGIDRQRQRNDPERGFAARLARLVCQPQVETNDDGAEEIAPGVEIVEQHIVLHPRPGESRGLTLSRLWPLSNLPPNLIGVGRFRRTSERTEQLEFLYREDGVADQTVEEPLISDSQPLSTPVSLAWDRALAKSRETDDSGLAPLAGRMLIVSNGQPRIVNRATGRIECTIDVPLLEGEKDPVVDSADWVSFPREKATDPPEKTADPWLTSVLLGVRVNTGDGKVATVKHALLEPRPLATLPGEVLDNDSKILVSLATRGKVGGCIEKVLASRVVSPRHGLKAGDLIAVTLEPNGDSVEYRVVDVKEDSFGLCVNSFPEPETKQAATWRAVSLLDEVQINAGKPPVLTTPDHGLKEGDAIEVIGEQPIVVTVLPKEDKPDHQFQAFMHGSASGDWSGGGTWNLVGDDTTKPIEDVSTMVPVRVTSKRHGLESGRAIAVQGTGNIDRSGSSMWFVLRIDDDRFALLDVPEDVEALKPGALWTKLKPIGDIAAFDGRPRTITVTDHKLHQGDRVHVRGVAGPHELNGLTRRVNRIDMNTFQVFANGKAREPAPANVPWRRLTAIGGVDTSSAPAVVRAAAHRLPPAASVTIVGVPGIEGINRSWISFPKDGDADHFELWMPRATSGIDGAGGTWKVPKETVSGNVTSASNETPIVITTEDAHNLNSGATVVIEAVTGNINANGSWRIEKRDKTHFALFEPASLTGDGQGGYWFRRDAASNDADVDVTSDASVRLVTSGHRLKEGDRVHTAGLVKGEGEDDQTAWFVHIINRQEFELWRDVVPPAPYLGGGAFSRLREVKEVRSHGEDGEICDLVVPNHGLEFGDRLVIEKAKGERIVPTKSLRAMTINQDVIELQFDKKIQPEDVQAESKWERPDMVMWASSVTGGIERKVWFGSVEADEVHKAGRLKKFSPTLATAWLETNFVALTCEGPEVQVWELSRHGHEDADPIATLKVDKDAADIVSLAAINDRLGRLVVAAGNDQGYVRVWLVSRTKSVLHTTADHQPFEIDKPAEVSLAFDDERLLIAVGCKSEIKIKAPLRLEDLHISGESGRVPVLVSEFDVPQPIFKLTAQSTPMGLRLLVSSGDPDLEVDDTKTVTTLSLWAQDPVLRIPSRPRAAPEFSLGIELSTGREKNQPRNIGNGHTIRARMSRTRQLEVFLHDKQKKREARALARLEQGPYHCFVVNATSASGDQGKGALILWTEGDLLADATTTSQTLSPPSRLGAALIWHDIEPNAAVSILDKNTDVSLSGPLLALNVLASQVGIKSETRWLHHRSESRILNSSQATSRLTLLLEGAGTIANGAAITLSGTLISHKPAKEGVGDSTEFNDFPTVELQAPVRFSASDATTSPKLKIVQDACWQEGVSTSTRSGIKPEIVHPAGKENALFHTAEATAVLQEIEERFVQLTLTERGGGLTADVVGLELQDVPLDRNLEPGGVRRVPRQAPDTMQVIHRQQTGTRLRYNMDESQFRRVLDPRDEAETLEFTSNKRLKLMLRPAVNDGHRIVLLEESAWLHELRYEGKVKASRKLTKAAKKNLIASLKKKLPGVVPPDDAQDVVRITSPWHTLREGDSIRLMGKPRQVIGDPDPDSAKIGPHRFYVAFDGEENLKKIKGSTWKREIAPEPLITESLMVIFRPRSVSAISDVDGVAPAPEFVTVLENRTLPENGKSAGSTTSSVAEEAPYFKELIKRAGAAGVAIVRRLDAAGNVQFRFINSPFFARASEDTLDDEGVITAALSENTSGLAGTLGAVAAAKDSSLLGGLDLRTLRPTDVIRWVTAAVFHLYRPEDRSDDPTRNRPCVPHRELRWQRRLIDADGQVHQTDFGSSVPGIRTVEATAFREMGKLFHLPETARRKSSRERQALFLPGTIDMRLAADKPGAVFHQLLQVQTDHGLRHNAAGQLPAWDLEPTVDFALREAQQIKVTGCVTSRVEIKEAKAKRLEENGQLAHLNVKWDEIVGTTTVNKDLARPPAVDPDDPTTTSPDWIRVTELGELELLTPPVQLVIQFNDEVLDVLTNEPAVPAYEVDYRDIVGNKQKLRHPARMFAITRLQDPALGDHRTLIDAYGTLQVVNAAPFTVKLEATSGPLPRPGGTIDLFGVDNDNYDPATEPNRANWRTLPLPDGDGTQFLLMRDTLPGPDVVEVNSVWSNAAGAQGSVTKVTNASPIVVELESEAGKLPATNEEIVIGSGADAPKFRVLGIDQNKFVLFRPASTTAAPGTSGQWHSIHARVTPYVQTAPVTKLKLVPGNGRESVTLKELSGLQTGDYLRIDKADKLPTALGDWRVVTVGGKNRLFRASSGNGKFISEAGGKLYGTRKTVKITDANNSAPIIITTDGRHGLQAGEIVSIAGVRGNTAANHDHWIVLPTGDRTIELYFDSRPGNSDGETPDPTKECDAIGARIVPFTDAFQLLPKTESQPARLYEFDTHQRIDDWPHPDRPLLQVMWATRIDTFANANGTQQGRFADLYDPIKQIKFLTPSQLSPKLAVVMIIKSEAGADPIFALHRTLLFGDAAPATNGTGRLTQKGKLFEFVVTDNREQLIFGLPAGGLPQPPKGSLYLLKYLTTGITIYDDEDVEIKTT